AYAGQVFAVLLRVWIERGLVDEAQVDHVDRDLRVEAGTQLVPHHPFHVPDRGALRQLERRDRFLADRVGVLPGDAEQVPVHEHRVAAAQRLRDVAGASDGQGDMVALGDADG